MGKINKDGIFSDAEMQQAEDDGTVRTFDSGATRDTTEGKHDPEGFLSPRVLQCYFEYMHSNRVQSDGSQRDSDNWQGGFGFPVLMKSTWRHFFDMWKIHRGLTAYRQEKCETIKVTMKDALCGLMFNVMGYLHEYLIAQDKLERPGLTMIDQDRIKRAAHFLRSMHSAEWKRP